MDRDVLVALYNATGGSNWLRRDGWLDDGLPLDQWHGVHTIGDGRVASLLLDENQLQEGDFVADSRRGLTWFEAHGYADDEYGHAETLSKAKNHERRWLSPGRNHRVTPRRRANSQARRTKP